MILGDRFNQIFRKAIHTTACPACRREFNASIAIREVWLNHIGDIIVEGYCRDCGNPLSKYIESNNFQEAYDQAMALRELKMEVLKNYNARPSGS